jgi:hypothetical protein
MYRLIQASVNFILVDSLFCSIDVGGWAAPTFTDLDGDGLTDLLIGNLDGRIYHYEQLNPDTVAFALVTDFLIRLMSVSMPLQL